MVDERDYRPQSARDRLTSDMQLRVANSIASYSKNPEGEIVCVPVVRSSVTDSKGEVLGLLWFADDEDGAGYVARQTMAPESVIVGTAWVQRLRAAKKDGLDPVQARYRLSQIPADPVLGSALISEARTMSSLDELRR